ncbi:hypothetical protein RND81_12G041300 [Saponaria officinalis]|uniref:Uncharacterized protein n=3 Tax=Saponaria officinalis TaxID=3572 RepID=A0AAW1H569_SAPOF
MSNSNAPLKRCSNVAVENEISNSDGDYIDVTKLSRPVEGMRLAVIPFLSNNGNTPSLVRCSTGKLVDFDIVCQKHLLICCVSLPLSTGSQYLCAIMEVYNSLSRDKFEMVMVASSDSTKAAFDEFFAELPCLAIPFSDLDARHYICSFIGFNLHFSCPKLSAVLVDPDEMIMHYLVTPDRFLTYGTEWFPFHDTHIEAVSIQDNVLRCRLDPFYKKRLQARGDRVSEAIMQDPLFEEPLSLYKDILLCDPSLALPRIGSVDGADESLTVLELSKKHVALYLHLGRDFLGDIIDLHQECIEKKLELEIILVCIALFGSDNSQEELIQDLRRENITSWFVFPKHNKIWRRLWRVFSLREMEDKMIILPPNGKSGELAGRAVVERCGVEEYPFTRTAILERRFTALRSLTPASLFKGNSKNRTCLVRKGKKRCLRQSSLQGKKLLVYFDSLQLSYDGGELCDLMMKLYPKIKAKGWEVVCVPLDHKHTNRHVKFANMLWPIMPIREDCEASVFDQLIFEGDDNYGSQVIAFREDGRIVSREAQKGLMKHELTDSLFCDNLYDELAYMLRCLG